MILPYVYKLTHKESGQFYIGFRCANKVRSELDIGFKYFTSSKYVKELGLEKFNIEILVEFFQAEDAYNFEQEMIQTHFNNPLCLNKSCFFGKGVFKSKPHTEESKQKISKANSGENNYMYGKKHSTDIRIKMSGINHHAFNKPVSIETRVKLSIANSGENNYMYGKTGTESPNYGKKRTEEHKANYSKSKSGVNSPVAKMVIVNGVNYISVKAAAIANQYDSSSLSKILTGKYNTNKKIWEARYVDL